MRTINVINRSSAVTDQDFRDTVAACQIQISRDFAPSWGIDAKLVIQPEDQSKERVYILDTTTQADVLGYHTQSLDIPVCYVFALTDLQAGGSWSDTLSHELVEMLADPLCNLCALGVNYGRPVLFAYETADPVENDEYLIGSKRMSNFVLPAWFSTGSRGRTDFLGKLPGPFTMTRGGYFSYQLKIGKWSQTVGQAAKPQQRLAGPYARRTRRREKQAMFLQSAG